MLASYYIVKYVYKHCLYIEHIKQKLQIQLEEKRHFVRVVLSYQITVAVLGRAGPVQSVYISIYRIYINKRKIEREKNLAGSMCMFCWFISLFINAFQRE